MPIDYWDSNKKCAYNMHVKMLGVPVESLSCKIDHSLNPWFDRGISLCLFFPIFFGVGDYLMQIVPFHRLCLRVKNLVRSNVLIMLMLLEPFIKVLDSSFCPCNWNILGRHLSKGIPFCLSTLIWQPCNPLHSKLNVHHSVDACQYPNNNSYIFWNSKYRK